MRLSVVSVGKHASRRPFRDPVRTPALSPARRETARPRGGRRPTTVCLRLCGFGSIPRGGHGDGRYSSPRAGFFFFCLRRKQKKPGTGRASPAPRRISGGVGCQGRCAPSTLKSRYTRRPPHQLVQRNDYSPGASIHTPFSRLDFFLVGDKHRLASLAPGTCKKISPV